MSDNDNNITYINGAQNNGDITYTSSSSFNPAEYGVTQLIKALGENPLREGLVDTPKRVVKAYKELTEGYNVNIAELLSVTFDVGNVDEMVIVKNINFVSLCEHHMLPFSGTATVAYIPMHRVVGLSKIPRTVDAITRRLQVQERITTEITEALDTYLKPLGSACLVKAEHTCAAYRGVRKQGAEMVTSSLTGVFRNPEVRNEFLALANS